jgi:hypothetical protein
MFEHRRQSLLPTRLFFVRLGRSAIVGLTIIAGSLIIGMAGYHYFEKLSWLDAFVNAAMILSGMGPLEPLKTNAGKVFAGCYALYSGLALITSAAVIFAPVVHRFLHKFHLQTQQEKSKD